jgi:hypothetical protein
VLFGGKSFGSADHWQPVDRTYITPSTTARSATVRLLPPGFAGGISGSTSAHSASVRSLG